MHHAHKTYFEEPLKLLDSLQLLFNDILRGKECNLNLCWSSELACSLFYVSKSGLCPWDVWREILSAEVVDHGPLSTSWFLGHLILES